MARGKERPTRFAYEHRFGPAPGERDAWEEVTRLIAEMIAQAFAEDHPELFVPPSAGVPASPSAPQGEQSNDDRR